MYKNHNQAPKHPCRRHHSHDHSTQHTAVTGHGHGHRLPVRPGSISLGRCSSPCCCRLQQRGRGPRREATSEVLPSTALALVEGWVCVERAAPPIPPVAPPPPPTSRTHTAAHPHPPPARESERTVRPKADSCALRPHGSHRCSAGRGRAASGWCVWCVRRTEAGAHHTAAAHAPCHRGHLHLVTVITCRASAVGVCHCVKPRTTRTQTLMVMLSSHWNCNGRSTPAAPTAKSRTLQYCRSCAGAREPLQYCRSCAGASEPRGYL
jgi:hypothetical protein